MDVLQRLSTISGGRILDVATGDGAFIRFLKEALLDFIEMIGVDNDQHVVQQAQAMFVNDPAVSIRVMDSARLDFPDRHFDMVCLSNSLHHVVQREATFQEMLRVVKIDGYLVINEMFRDEQNGTQLTFVDLHHWRAEIDRLRGIPHGYTLSKSELVDLIGQLGLTAVECFEYRNTAFDTFVNKEKFAGWHQTYSEQIRDLPEYATYKARGAALIQRIFDIGVEFPTQLLCLGKLPSC